ncbi:MAG: hypothetical protein FJ011_23190 [Chloroflexi bacterium]|nr:hypothetical protein [Chloroflexota bacterium]
MAELGGLQAKLANSSTWSTILTTAALGGGVGGRVAQGIGVTLVIFPSDDQPFFRQLAVAQGPDAPHGKGIAQGAAFGAAYLKAAKAGLGRGEQLADFNGRRNTHVLGSQHAGRWWVAHGGGSGRSSGCRRET